MLFQVLFKIMYLQNRLRHINQRQLSTFKSLQLNVISGFIYNLVFARSLETDLPKQLSTCASYVQEFFDKNTA